MNVLHLRYAVEVAKVGSINKAAENLIIAQPNLSRSIKELEAYLGITIFDRSAQGMMLTAEGEEFIIYAQKIIRQIDEVEAIYKEQMEPKKKFSAAAPRASYISEAFVNFSSQTDTDSAELYYKETNSLKAIRRVASSECNLGIIRYSEHYNKYFAEMLDEKGLTLKTISEFRHKLTMNKNCLLNQKAEIFSKDLIDYTEIAYPDMFVPYLPPSEVKKGELTDDVNRRIFIFERASKFELLSADHQAFIWASPIPSKLLNMYGLVQRECSDNQKVYRDVLIYRKDYKLTELDKRFIKELEASKEKYL